MEAAAHSQESFEAVTYDLSVELGEDSQNFGYYFRRLNPDWKSSFDFEKLSNMFTDFLGGKEIPLKKAWLVKYEADFFEMNFGLRKTLEGAFNYVSDIANTFCGKQFAIPLPYSVSQQEQVQGIINTTEVPCDSGWSDEDYILGLNRSLTSIFSDDTSKVRPFGLIDASSYETFNTENYLVYEDAYVIRDSITGVNVPTPSVQHYVSCGVDSELVYTNAFNLIGPHVVVVFDSPIRRVSADGNLSLVRQRLIDKGFDETDIDQFILKMHGTEYTNIGIQKINGIPLAIAIPLRNNYITYGPWVYTGAPGNTSIEVDQSLAPWEYGGSDLMNLAGQNKANSIAINTQTVETGSITLPGYPTISLGAELLSNGATTIETRNILLNNSTGFSQNKKYLNVNAGKWTGLLGPNITNISCEIGEQGITTTYEMRSYTAVYGRFNRSLFDRIKLLGQQDLRIRRQNILNKLNFNFILSKNSDYVKHSVARMASGLAPLNYAAFDALRRSRSPVNVISGNIYNDASAEGEQEHADVGINKSNSILNELHSSGYAGKAMMSLDGLLRPISKDGDGDFPKFNPEAIAKSHSNAVFPPVSGVYYPIKIGSTELYPLQSGHDIEMLARGDQPPQDGKSLYLEGDYAEDYRFFGLKGPLVMTGWGYDTNNKPIPNEADTEARNGKFATTKLTDNFLDGHLGDSRAWPTGPIDLRYDRARGVWTSPQPYRIVLCQITEENNNNKKQREDQGTASFGWYGGEDNVYSVSFDPREPRQQKYSAVILNKSTAEDSTGAMISGAAIVVYPIDKRMILDKYDKVLAYYDTVEEKYYVIEHFGDNKIYLGRVKSHGLNCQDDLNVAIADVEPFSDDFTEPAELEKAEDEDQVSRASIKVHFFNVRPFSFPFVLNQTIAFAKVKGIYVAIGDYCTPFRFAIGRIISPFGNAGFLVQYSMNAPNEAFPEGASKGPFGGSFAEVPTTGIGTQVGSNNPTGLGYTPINLIGYAHNILNHPLYLGQLVYLQLDESCIPTSFEGQGGEEFEPPEALFFIMRGYHYPVCVVAEITILPTPCPAPPDCGGGAGIVINVKPVTMYLDTAAFDGTPGFAKICASSKICKDVEYECCSSNNNNDDQQQAQQPNRNRTIDKGKFQIGTSLSVFGQAPQCFF